MAVRTFRVEGLGIGKPDYTRKVSSSLQRRGIKLDYEQTLKSFGVVFSDISSPYPWIITPLAPGATVSVLDYSTGVPVPYLVPQGYVFSLIAAGGMLTEDAIALGYMDDDLVLTIGVLSAGSPYYENYILGLTTETIDPLGLTSHTVDITLKNLGTGNLSGGVTFIAIVEAVGTPPLPTVKTVRCKFCGHEEVVPQETTRWICTVCGKLNIYYDLTNLKGTR